MGDIGGERLSAVDLVKKEAQRSVKMSSFLPFEDPASTPSVAYIERIDIRDVPLMEGGSTVVGYVYRSPVNNPDRFFARFKIFQRADGYVCDCGGSIPFGGPGTPCDHPKMFATLMAKHFDRPIFGEGKTDINLVKILVVAGTLIELEQFKKSHFDISKQQYLLKGNWHDIAEVIFRSTNIPVLEFSGIHFPNPIQVIWTGTFDKGQNFEQMLTWVTQEVDR